MTPANRVLASQLWHAVESLSLDADAQTTLLRDESLNLADELALSFDDVYPALERLVADGALSVAAVLPLAELDEALSSMSGDPARWQLSALVSDAGWETVRRRARIALSLLQPAA